MKYECDYCGFHLNASDEKCPGCGAVNSHYVKVAPKQPKTIEELKLWYEAKNLPDEKITRFFIGKDIKEPRAFGIYQDENTGKFIVYKNKDTGARAVRYEGDDEAFAVNELYQKLRERIAEQKANNSKKKKSSYKKKKSGFWRDFVGSQLFVVIASLILIFFATIVAIITDDPSDQKYYEYEDNYYYNLDGSYYYYDYDIDDWSYYGSAPFDESDYEQYEIDCPDDVGSFTDTDYYSNWYDEHHSSSDDDDDWDSGWDSGDSWDSGGGDWSSDW